MLEEKDGNISKKCSKIWSKSNGIIKRDMK